MIFPGCTERRPHDRVLGGSLGTLSLRVITPRVVCGQEVPDRVNAELRQWRRGDKLLQAEGGAGAVDLQKELKPGERNGPAQPMPGIGVLTGERPRIALFLFEHSPAGGDAPEIGANAYLRWVLGSLGDDILALDLTVAGASRSPWCRPCRIEGRRVSSPYSCQAEPATPVNSRVLAARESSSSPHQPDA